MVASHTTSRGPYRMLYMVASHTTSRGHIGCYIWWPLAQLVGVIWNAIYGGLSHNLEIS